MAPSTRNRSVEPITASKKVKNTKDSSQVCTNWVKRVEKLTATNSSKSISRTPTKKVRIVAPQKEKATTDEDGIGTAGPKHPAKAGQDDVCMHSNVKP